MLTTSSQDYLPTFSAEERCFKYQQPETLVCDWFDVRSDLTEDPIEPHVTVEKLYRH
jgi:hypothetical protein